MSKLSPRQREVLFLIQQGIKDNGFAPTRVELAKSMGLSAVSGINQHLKALETKGVIRVLQNLTRGIRLVKRPYTKRDATSTSTLEGDAQHNNNVATPSLPRTSAVNGLRRMPAVTSLALPLVGRVAAGVPILAEQNISAIYNVDPSLFSQIPDYLLRVEGMSMKDVGILHGDLLAVKHSVDVKSGQIIVARLDDEVTVKRFKRIAGRIELQAANAEFETIVVSSGDTVHYQFVVEGLYVGVIRGKP